MNTPAFIDDLIQDAQRLPIWHQATAPAAMFSVLTQYGSPSAPTPESATPKSMVAMIRSVWGLNITQLAQVLNVERPTIYLWSSLTDIHRVQRQKLDRLLTIYRLAQQWQAKGVLPSTCLTTVIGTAPTLLELLSAQDMASTTILQLHEQLRLATIHSQASTGPNAKEFGAALSIAIRRKAGAGQNNGQRPT
jgi:hypothetical protein